MKKLSFAILLPAMYTQTFAADLDRALRSIDPLSIMAVGMGGIIFFIGVLLAYVATAYGVYLLAKKYAPKVHSAWSWIPVANLYPLIVVSRQSPWWIVAILLGQFIPTIGIFITLGSIIFIYYHLAKRVGRGVGTTMLLLFFSVIMIPYLGLKAHKKPTTAAWILGICAIIAVFVGMSMTALGAGKAAYNLERDYNISEKIEKKIFDEIQNNPEFREQSQEAQATIQANIETEGNVDVGQ